MKKHDKVFGVIALVAVITTTMVSCDDGGGSNKKADSAIAASRNITENSTAVITDKYAFINDEPSYYGSTFQFLAAQKVKGMVLKINGEVVLSDGVYWIPVEYQGQQGYILPDYVKIKK